MQAIVKSERSPGADVTEIEKPKIKSNEVLVKVKVASICGTDVHIWDWNEWAQSRITPPLVMGHEFTGEVVQVGRDVKTVHVGDTVSAETHIVDGTCYQCRTDRMHVCRNLKILGVDVDGVFAEFVALPERNAWKNDLKLDPFVASMQEPLGNAVQSCLPRNNIEDIAGKYCAVTGCGPIGLMSIAVLKELGAEKVFASAGGRNTRRIQLAKEIGADLVLSNAELGDSLVQAIIDETGGRGVDVVLEMSGSPVALRHAIEMLTPGGRISLLGLLDRPVEHFDLNRWVFKAATVHCISGRRMFETWYQVNGLLEKKGFVEKISSIVTHKLSMKDVAKGMDLIHTKQAAKVALTLEP